MSSAPFVRFLLSLCGAKKKIIISRLMDASSGPTPTRMHVPHILKCENACTQRVDDGSETIFHSAFCLPLVICIKPVARSVLRCVRVIELSSRYAETNLQVMLKQNRSMLARHCAAIYVYPDPRIPTQAHTCPLFGVCKTYDQHYSLLILFRTVPERCENSRTKA